MARGPSRRSGSRSGGSRSSSRSRSYSSSRSYRSYGTSYSYGRRRVYRSGRSSLASFLIFFLVIMIMATMSLWSDYEYNKNELDYMKKDSETYYDMVENAHTNQLYKTTQATVRDVWSYYWESEGTYYYQIEYSYKNEFTDTYKYGNYTYYMYTRSEIMDMGYGSFLTSYYNDNYNATIEIVYSEYDQINMDYNLYCADYYMYEEEYQSCIGGMFVTGGISFVLVVIIMKLLKKDKQNREKNSQQTTTTYSTTYTTNSQNGTGNNSEFPDFNTMFNGMFNNTTTEKERYCEYCGSKILSGDIKCSSCGANIKKSN